MVRVSTAVTATADVLRTAPSPMAASSPKASPGPWTVRVTTSPSGVVTRMATTPSVDHVQRVAGVALVEQRVRPPEPAPSGRRQQRSTLVVREQVEQ